ncbi:hypothetical protein BCR42DRAFT_403762, partial [Absidia repens]
MNVCSCIYIFLRQYDDGYCSHSMYVKVSQGGSNESFFGQTIEFLIQWLYGTIETICKQRQEIPFSFF